MHSWSRCWVLVVILLGTVAFPGAAWAEGQTLKVTITIVTKDQDKLV